MHRNEETVFEAALHYRDPVERHAYVVKVCGTDAKLQADVEALLQAHDSQSLLDEPVLECGPNCGTLTLLEGPGTVIGRYKLLEKIGEGGMAVVYMAEQTEPLRRKVALKIIKLGMDTRQVIARFEAERQALALMDHPSIAKVLDAGATEAGWPYFVMELVQGVSITEYCDRNSLNTKERLHLFLQVCQAVQHAHTKGIIHRDLKPSNVMVTHHDGKPIPKVIDFGIAKATHQKLTEKTLFTRYAHLIGTPAYMSPEQAELSDLDIDTRTDIYSLGVLLYELLTGTTPFSEGELRKAGYLEMQRVIREQEPVKPSTRIKTALRRASVPLAVKTSWRGRLALACRGHPARDSRAASARSAAARRARHQEQGRDALATSTTGETPVVLVGGTGSPNANECVWGPRPMLREVRGDLDWIVMKSLEKDRARRYETASGLAEDLRRHLEHEPVLARGPGAAYRLRKFLRRHRSQILSALVLAVAAGAAVVGLSQWSQGRRRLAEAEGLRQQAEGLQHKEILSQAQEQYAKGDRDAALEAIQPILSSQHVGPEARLLQAGLLVDNRHPEEAVKILNGLLEERPEITGAAHALWARILWESESLDAEKLKGIEEHRQKAETLLPETAEAYFLRAMTAVTIKEQLAALDRALDLDAKYYESRRLRAFTYYASRKYEHLSEEAYAMELLRERDPLGYSLRAMALRELGRYKDAIAEYDRAILRTTQGGPQHLDLATQRGETLLRMGRYERAIAEALEATRLWPDQPVFQYHLFCARTALGDANEAAEVFQKIVGSAPTARNEFWVCATQYVFDTLGAGRSWHPSDRQPAGAAFLPLVEAEETYRGLSAKGYRVLSDGFNAHWSPDGTKLAFNLGVRGYSGVAVFDPATRETELLIVPGKDPRWSPDGGYIAFVRDRQFVRVEELVAADPKSQSQPRTDEEVWLMKSDGTEPRRLARGTWPSWGRDSTSLYYHSPLDSALYSISITDSNMPPERVMSGPLIYPSVSPDNRRVAYLSLGGASLKVGDLASQTLVAEWDLPFGIWSPPAWSPTGEELAVGAASSVGDRTGLWIYRLDGKEPVKVLDSQIMSAAWAPDGTKLAFGLRPPYFDLWTAELDPGLSTIEALGPGQTLDEHWRQMLRLYTHRIEADPQDAYAYSDRARYYDHLHEETEVNADMRRWSTVMSGRSPADSRFGTPRGFRRIIEMPFDCELVFSAERPVNQIPIMSIAFGQKGRCEMKLFEIPMVVMSMLGFWFLSGIDVLTAQADFTFGTPVSIGPTVNNAQSYGPCLSPDGRELYFHRDPGEIWVARRASPDDEWGPPSNLGSPVNSPYYDGGPSLSADGLSLYLFSDRPGTLGSWDLWVTTRATVSDNWGTPVHLGATVNSAFDEYAPCISADGLELYFTSNRSGGYGGWDLWVTTRATAQDAWGVPVNLGPTINTSAQDNWPGISPDGLLLLFSSSRPGGSGSWELYMARRATRKGPWGAPMNLGPTVNSPTWEVGAKTSHDGSMLLFHSVRPGGFSGCDLWQAPITRIVDFNGDGKVDAKEMALLVDNWGKNTTVCDIGPFAWGDGVVDERDLRILMESLMTPGPKASDVPCDVVLNWISPSFAQACDVYLGTSVEAVTTASRTNPQGVLVSQGQTATTYDPPGLLEFSQTYYWRVDFVLDGQAQGPAPTGTLPTIIQGPVLSFTTAGLTYPIKNITATASSAQAGCGPERTVDSSGLDKNDGHSIDQKDMWWSTGAGSNWIQYEFDRIYHLHELWVWNFNSMLEPFMGFGAKTVKIEYSTDGTAWTILASVPEFKKAPGKAGYTADTKIAFGGIPAKFVRLTIEKNWGVAPQTGLSEVRFFCIQSVAGGKP